MGSDGRITMQRCDSVCEKRRGVVSESCMGEVVVDGGEKESVNIECLISAPKFCSNRWGGSAHGLILRSNSARQYF
jgi:hypothetical protein